MAIVRPNFAGQSGFTPKAGESLPNEAKVSETGKSEVTTQDTMQPKPEEPIRVKRQPEVLPVRKGVSSDSHYQEVSARLKAVAESSMSPVEEAPVSSSVKQEMAPVLPKASASVPASEPKGKFEGKRDSWNDARYIQVHGIPPELMAAVRAQVPSAKSNPAALSAYLYAKLPGVMLPASDQAKLSKYELSEDESYFRNLTESVRVLTDKCDRMMKQLDGLQMALSYLIQDRLGNLSGESREGKRFSTPDVVDMGVKLDADIEGYRNQKHRRGEHYRNTAEYRDSHKT